MMQEPARRCLPPFAWSAFKLKFPYDASIRPGQIGSRFDLECVNADVNHISAQHGVLPPLDEWLIWPARAWCHDYAVTKRHELLAIGWPSSALLLAECRTSRGEGHMVLIADGLVLDNLRAELLPAVSTGYDWSLPVQSAADPNVWVKS